MVQYGDWLKIRSLCDQKLKAHNDRYCKYTLIHSTVKVFSFLKENEISSGFSIVDLIVA